MMVVFQVVASTTTVNVEAQAMLPLPTSVVIKTPRTPASAVPVPPVKHSPLDDLFGHTLSITRTLESRHDHSAADVLPPYAEDMPPPYSLRCPEPVTLAKYLFKFGFIFPPFWILGTCILWSPLRTPTNHLDVEGARNKTDSERQRVIAEIRRVEVRWALRCLWAILILTLLAALAGIAVWVVLYS